MKRLQAFLLVIATSSSFHCCIQADGHSNSAIRLIVTKKGLDYFSEIGADAITFFIGLQLQQFKRIHIKQLEFQNFSIFSAPQTGVNLRSHANVNFCVDVNFFKAHIHFCLTMRAALHLAAKINRGKYGVPLVNFTKCSVNIEQLNDDGSDSSFMTQVLVLLVKYIMKTGLTCGFLEALVEDTFTQYVPKLKGIKLSNFAEISLALVSDPVFLKDKIIIDVKGDIQSRDFPSVGQTTEQISHLQWEDYENCQDRMVCVGVPDTVANKAAMVYRRAGVFIYNFTNYNVVDNSSFFKLDTTTFSLVVPQLYHRYPDHNLTMTARALREPTVKISAEGAIFRIPAAVDVYVNHTEENDSLSLAFTMNANATVDATLGIGNCTDSNTCSLTAEITNIQMTIKKKKSNIGEIDFDKINKLTKAFHLFKKHVLPTMKEVAQQGYTVNLTLLKLVEPNFIHYDGGLLLTTDFIFKLI